MEEAGFIDAYRHFFPDEIKHPGFTWTPVTERGDPDDHHDRIDFVYVRGSGISVTEALVIGESAQTSDMIVAPWPSDHRGVMVSIELSRE